MPRISIYVPEDIRLRMHKAPKTVNWSEIAQKAFASALGAKPNGAEPPYNYRVVSRCIDSYNYGETKCKAVHYSNGETRSTCGEPCAFVMRKAGAGHPPYLDRDTITEEIKKLLFRESRGTFRE
jgi:hypothetical protein